MKTFNRIFAAVLIFTFSSSAFAQDNNVISSFATVLPTTSIDEKDDLNFGEISTFGDWYTIGHDNDGAGYFDITTNSNISISFVATDLTATGGAAENFSAILPFRFNEDSGNVVAGDTQLAFNPNAPLSLTFGDDNTRPFLLARSFRINLGGAVEVEDFQYAGTYEGSITITLENN